MRLGCWVTDMILWTWRFIAYMLCIIITYMCRVFFSLLCFFFKWKVLRFFAFGFIIAIKNWIDLDTNSIPMNLYNFTLFLECLWWSFFFRVLFSGWSRFFCLQITWEKFRFSCWNGARWIREDLVFVERIAGKFYWNLKIF